ncbi:hypothetical protein ACVWW4_007629 [Bradyrhizobium sp. LB7.1]
MRHLGDIEAGEFDLQRLGLQSRAVAGRAVLGDHELRDAALHHRTLRLGIGLHHVALCAGESALIARLLLAAKGSFDLGRSVTGIDRNGRLLLREQDPVAVLFGQLTPGLVHVVTERRQDVPEVLPLPGTRPGRDGALADGPGVVGHHGFFGDVEHPADTVTGRAGSFRRVRRERFRIEHRLSARVIAGTGVEHPEQVRDGGHAADRRPRRRRAALLLERYGGRQAFDVVNLWDLHLVEQPPRVRRHRFQISTLRPRHRSFQRRARISLIPTRP